MTVSSIEWLREAGLGERDLPRKAALFARADAALGSHSGAPIARWLWVPGRIEVLGKHTDYAGGRSLLCAAERGLCVAWRPRVDRTLSIRDASRSESVAADLSPALEPPARGWARYPLTVARRVAHNFPQARRGVDMALASDLPPAAGMSSSSAVIVATFLALADANELAADPLSRQNLVTCEDLAGYLGAIENGQGFGSLAGERGVGTMGGSEDHTAILCARPGMLVQYGFAPVRFERAVAVPSHLVFVVAASGVVADKTGAARERYNEAARTVTSLLALWREATGRDDASLAAAVRSAPGAREHLLALARDADARGVSHAPLEARLAQFATESEEIVPAATDALGSGDLDRFGTLVDRSQAAAERGLQNAVPETTALARSARELGAVAASAFGAGFGGSVWALVPGDTASEFRGRWKEAYAVRFPAAASRAQFFETLAGPPTWGREYFHFLPRSTRGKK